MNDTADQADQDRLDLLKEKVKELSSEELAALADLLRRQSGDTTEELKVVAGQIARIHARGVKQRHPL